MQIIVTTEIVYRGNLEPRAAIRNVKRGPDINFILFISSNSPNHRLLYINTEPFLYLLKSYRNSRAKIELDRESMKGVVNSCMGLPECASLFLLLTYV